MLSVPQQRYLKKHGLPTLPKRERETQTIFIMDEGASNNNKIILFSL
jgi:hypothetical protein